MKDTEIINQAHHLRIMQQTTGWIIFKQKMEEMQKEGFENFMKLAPEKMTGKQAYNFKAHYNVIQELKEWLDDEIDSGAQAEKVHNQKAGLMTP